MKVEKVKSSRSPQKRRRAVFVTILAVLILLILLVNFITDWMWFAEMKYVSVFFTKLFTQLKIGIPTFLVLWILIDLYLKHLKKGYFKKIESHEETDVKKLVRYTRLVACVFSFLITMYAVQALWFKWLKFRYSTGVGIKDPLFKLDIGFYLFKLDFLETLNSLLLGIVLLFILMTVIYYLILLKMHSPEIFETDYTQNDDSPIGKVLDHLQGNSQGDGQGKRLDRENLISLGAIASDQLTVLIVIFYLMLAANFALKQFDLLHDHTGTVYGAGFVDVNVRIWIYRILMAMAAVGIVTAVHHIRKKSFRKLVRVPVIMIAIGIVGSLSVSAVQNLIVAPDELNKETKYLSRNIDYTQYAYDLKDVSVRKFAADENLTAKDIRNNSQTISNIRINDYDPVKDFYNQTQSIRQYYTFNDVDVDRYVINGKLTQTYLSPREIDETKISDTWLNRHLKYTHGYSMTISQVNEVTASGQPDVLLKNIPPETKVKSLKIRQPSIYFGELTNDYSLVNTDEDEFDYPDGSENKYTKYSGKAGIKMNLFARVMFALREHSLKLLVSTNINRDSRIIIYRNIEQRVKKIMPYLAYEDDPYSVIVDGRLFWIVDAYTTSSNYPYSEPYSEEVGTSNYIRNSVKVVIDAYNGDVTYYVIDKDEPIARTFQKIYPKLFRDFKEMPDELKKHIRYPNNLFEIQAEIFSRYHMKNVRVFYQDEDRWDISNEIYGTKERQMIPNYYIVNLPGEKNAEFINSIPFTPKSKQNMTALMIARNDENNYGKLVLYQFPKSKTIYGPMQIEAQIDQNTEISRDFSLWSSAGSNYKRGNLFVIPIEDSLLYIEPVYLEASNSAIPEVKRVIVVYGDKIAYEKTLGDALNEMFGDDGGATTSQSAGGKASDKSGAGKTQADYIQDAQSAYNKAQAALKKGDWAEYGKQMKVLENSLNALK